MKKAVQSVSVPSLCIKDSKGAALPGTTLPLLRALASRSETGRPDEAMRIDAWTFSPQEMTADRSERGFEDVRSSRKGGLKDSGEANDRFADLGNSPRRVRVAGHSIRLKQCAGTSAARYCLATTDFSMKSRRPRHMLSIPKA